MLQQRCGHIRDINGLLWIIYVVMAADQRKAVIPKVIPYNVQVFVNNQNHALPVFGVIHGGVK